MRTARGPGCSAALKMPMSPAVSGVDNSNAASRPPRADWGGTVPMAQSTMGWLRTGRARASYQPTGRTRPGAVPSIRRTEPQRSTSPRRRPDPSCEGGPHSAHKWRRSLSRDALADAIRDDGHGVFNARASLLLRILKAEPDATVGAAGGRGSSPRGAARRRTGAVARIDGSFRRRLIWRLPIVSVPDLHVGDRPIFSGGRGSTPAPDHDEQGDQEKG
jgi:hypothetical protein